MSEIKDRIPQTFERLEKALNEWTREGVDHLDETMKASMRLPKSGKRSGSHVASAPGESPAVRSGELLNSLSRDYQFLKSTEYTRDPKAIYLETGTSKMAARPLWEKTLREKTSFLGELLEKKLKEAEN